LILKGDAMRRWKSWLISSTAMLTAGLAATDAHAEDWYMSLFGGANMLEDTGDSFSRQQGFFTAGPTTGTTVNFTGTSDLDFDTGWAVGGAFGTRILPDLRGEVEFTYRSNKGDQSFAGTIQTITQPGGATATFTTAGNGDAEIDSYTLMANVWYEIPTDMSIHPYFGGGIGWGWLNADFDPQVVIPPGTTRVLDLFEDDETENGFAYQLGAGVAMDFTRYVTGFVEYRYQNTLDVNFGSSSNAFDADITNHTVQFGVRIPMK
jgi:outer membrane immunogenic protein